MGKEMHKKVIMMMEKTADFYDAYSINCGGIYAGGKDIEEVKKNTMEAIALIKEELPESRWPEEIKGDFTLEFQFDTASFLEYYKDILTLSGLERITGINQKQLSKYINNRCKPRQAQKDRINKGIRKFASELIAVSV